MRVQEPHANFAAPPPQDASLGLAEAGEASETVRHAMLDPAMRCQTVEEALLLLKDVQSLAGATALSPALMAAADNRKGLSKQGDGLFLDGLGGRWSSGLPYAAPSRVTEQRRMLVMLKPHDGVSPLVALKQVCVELAAADDVEPEAMWDRMMIRTVEAELDDGSKASKPFVPWNYKPSRSALLAYDAYLVGVGLCEGVLGLFDGGGDVFTHDDWKQGGFSYDEFIAPLMSFGDVQSRLFLSVPLRDAINHQLRGSRPDSDLLHAWTADGERWELEISRKQAAGPLLRTVGEYLDGTQEFVQLGTPYIVARIRRWDDELQLWVWWWDAWWCWIILQIWLLEEKFCVMPLYLGHTEGKVTPSGINGARTMRGQTAEVRAASTRGARNALAVLTLLAHSLLRFHALQTRAFDRARKDEEELRLSIAGFREVVPVDYDAIIDQAGAAAEAEAKDVGAAAGSLRACEAAIADGAAAEARLPELQRLLAEAEEAAAKGRAAKSERGRLQQAAQAEAKLAKDAAKGLLTGERVVC